MRKWNDTWQLIALKAGYCTGYEIDDYLLKEVIMKIYYNNHKHLIAKKEDVIKEIQCRKLIKTILHGDYTPHGVLFAVEGSPPKGSIYVTNIDYALGNVFLYDHGKMKNCDSQKYIWVKRLFLNEAKKILEQLSKDSLQKARDQL